jgi:hypothetical protein
MTISERIQLHKLGYTKEEINELNKAGYDPKGLETEPVSAPEAQPEQDPDPTTPEVSAPEAQPDPQAEILKAIQGLTTAIQQSNIVKSRQPEQAPETAEDILSKLL